jgi:hypothetical protein
VTTTITLNTDGSASWSTDWEALIKQEIDAKLDHAHVAQTYSYLIRSGYQQWTTLNPLIIARYGKAGFQRIKALAWQRIEDAKEQGDD